MSLKIDRVQLQFEIKPDYDQQQLQALQEDLRKANRELSKTERELDNLKKQKPTDPAELAKWRKNIDDLNKKYRDQVTAVQTAQQAIDKHVEKIGLENLSLAELSNRARTLNTILRNMNPNSPSYKQYEQQLQQINNRIKELKGTATSTRLSLSKLADGFNRYATLAASAVASLTGLALTIRKCTDDFAKMEDVMAGVRKYTGQTDEEVREMNEDFKKMDTRTSREQLNELAGAAGRLGITSKEMIEEFVDGADKIGVALGDDLGEGAVDTIGKLAIAFGEDKTKGLRGAMLATGSALNEIVQNSPAQAQPVIEFTEKLSGVGQMAHLTQAQIMGFAAALDQNNQEMATSSTVMSQLITKMYQNPQRFAQMAGMEVKKFRELIHTDMNQALVEWLQHVNKLGDMSVLAGKFDELKMDGTRAVGVLSTLAGHVDQVTEAQRIATKAYEEGTSVIEEFNIQNSTVQAELDKARKRFADLSIELGEKLLPIARYAVTTGGTAVKLLSKIIDFTSNYRATIVAVTAALAALVVAEKADVAQKKLMAFWNDKVVAGTKKLWALLVAHPYAAVAAAIAVVIGLLIDYTRRASAASMAEKTMNEIRQEAIGKVGDQETKIRALIRAAKDETLSLTERQKAIDALNRIIPQYNAHLDETTGKYVANKQKLDEYIQSLVRQYEVQGAKDRIEKLSSQISEAQDAVDDAQKVLDNARKTSGSTYTTTWGAVGNTATDAKRMAQDRLDDANRALKSLEKTREKLLDRWGKDIANGVINETESTNSPDSPNTPNTPTTPTTPTKEENKLLAAARKRMKQEEDLAKAERQKADLEAKQQYQKNLLTEEEYHAARYKNETAYIARIQQIRDNDYSTEAEKQEAQNMALDALINEANYQREQKQKDLQKNLELLEQSYNADQIAIEQQLYNGEFSTKVEYDRKKIEAEIDYQRERLRIIREAGGETLEAENALNRALLQQTKEMQNERKKDLSKQMENAELKHDFAQQLSIQKQMLAEGLISQEEYEKNVTEIVKNSERQRQTIREAYMQQAQAVMQSLSTFFSAMQSREEDRVTKKYKTLIERAKKNGKDTTKLEEQQEEEKNIIRKKYADKQFAMTALQIIANTAAGISKIWAEWGWNPPTAIGLTAAESAVGAIQLATAKAQRDQAAGLYTGGYNDDVEGYTGNGNPREIAGTIPVHKQEFVINHESLKIPVVKRVADVIDNAQKRKSYNIENTTRILQNTIISRNGFANGGYTSTPSVPYVATQSQPSDSRILEAITLNTQTLEKLLDEGITILRLRKEIKHQETLEANAQR